MEKPVLISSASRGFFPAWRGHYLRWRHAGLDVALEMTADGQWAIRAPRELLDTLREELARDEEPGRKAPGGVTDGQRDE
ncbi:MAG TPA: hypothetical protein VHN99_06125 [Deinococcales bacterium]|nr:hypothetical protein [Deinococcales bacterium]